MQWKRERRGGIVNSTAKKEWKRETGRERMIDKEGWESLKSRVLSMIDANSLTLFILPWQLLVRVQAPSLGNCFSVWDFVDANAVLRDYKALWFQINALGKWIWKQNPPPPLRHGVGSTKWGRTFLPMGRDLLLWLEVGRGVQTFFSRWLKEFAQFHSGDISINK